LTAYTRELVEAMPHIETVLPRAADSTTQPETGTISNCVAGQWSVNSEHAADD
jgi:hypothetical protein